MDYTGYGDTPKDELSLRQAMANILRGLTSQQQWQALGQGVKNAASVVPNTAESLARGGVAQAIGAVGDLRDLNQTIKSYMPETLQNVQTGMEFFSNPLAQALAVPKAPTTKQTLDFVPRITSPYEGYEQHEELGTYIAPTLAKGGAALEKGALKASDKAVQLISGNPEATATKVIDYASQFSPVKMAQELKRNDLGLYSTLEEAVNNLPQEKGTGTQILAQLLKTPAVKQEEVAYRGLDKFLENNPKVTKQEIQDYLSRTPVKLRETVLDDNYQGTQRTDLAEDYRIRDGDMIDDYDYIDSRAEDYMYEFRNDPNMRMQVEEDFLTNRADDYPDWQNNPTVAEQLRQDIDDALYDRAYQMAKEEYYDNPYYRYTDEYGGEITGNDDVGYSITLDGRNITPDRGIYDLSDAEDLLRERHVEQGNLVYEAEGGPKYADYQLEGPSKNYREVLVQIDQKNVPEYQSGHFDEPNILAHMRVNDRVIDGKKTLFIEEVQSDWHQEGRKKGYRTDVSDQRKQEIQAELALLSGKKTYARDARDQARLAGQPTDPIDMELARIERQQVELRKELEGVSGVPDAPYKKNWHELAMRRAIQMAVDEGYDRVAFTTGAQQADRYNLAKQVNSIDWTPYESRGANKLVTIVPKNGNRIELPLDKDGRVIQSIGGQFAGKSIDDIVGKDIAKKIMETETDELSGSGLSIGGEGMKGFYDKILPDYVNKYGKKYGMKVGKADLPINTQDQIDIIKANAGRTYGVGSDAYNQALKNQYETVHYFDITPEAKKSLLEKGSPLFAAPALSLTDEETRREMLERLLNESQK